MSSTLLLFKLSCHERPYKLALQVASNGQTKGKKDPSVVIKMQWYG